MDWEFGVQDECERPGQPWLPIAAPQANTCHWLRAAQGRFTANWSRMLREWRLIPSEWAVLRELYRPGRRGTVELAQALGMSRGGMSKLIGRLVKRGYVRKEPSQYDRRFRPLRLTRYAKRCVPPLAALQKQLDREFLAPLGNSRRFRLTQWLQRVLGPGRKGHLHQWVLDHLEKPPALAPQDDEAKSAKRRRAEYEALSIHLEKIAHEAELSFFGYDSAPDPSVR